MVSIQSKVGFYGLLGLLIFCVVIIRLLDSPLKNEVTPNGIVSFELAKEVRISRAIIASWDEPTQKKAHQELIVDFFFLVVYSSFIAVLLRRLRERFTHSSVGYQIGKVLGILIFVAALLDVVENIALLRLLGGDYAQVWSSTAFYCGSAKFGLILLSLIYWVVGWFQVILRKPQNP